MISEFTKTPIEQYLIKVFDGEHPIEYVELAIEHYKKLVKNCYYLENGKEMSIDDIPYDFSVHTISKIIMNIEDFYMGAMESFQLSEKDSRVVMRLLNMSPIHGGMLN